ncbi:MAG: hypothetical protein U9O66_00810 [Patescibacteria group bacterium]|nr:hypothetical protein [Patescibacteria group bacterium]
MINEKIKGRGGSSIEIIDDTINIKKKAFKGEIFFNKSDISSIEIKKSIYDLPFFEKTLIFQIGSKKYKIKRLPSKKLKEFKNFFHTLYFYDKIY